MAPKEPDALVASATRAAQPVIVFLMGIYFFAVLDRLNVGFAALTMNKSLGLSPAQFGFGGGLFFLVYVLVEVPSNIMLQQVGARRWIARIAMSWGLCSAGTALVVGANSFFLARGLLGVAEAGFFPAVITYIAGWYPAAYRSRMNNLFMLGIPLTGVLASVFSAGCLALDGTLGIAGWRWLFLLEGLPATVLGILALRILPDSPKDARFLSAEQKQALLSKLAHEDAAKQAKFPLGLGSVFRSPICWILGFAYFGITVGLSTIAFWLPQAVGSLGVKDPVTVGLLTAGPLAVGAAIMTTVSWNSDRTGQPAWHLLAMALLAAAGWLLFGVSSNPILSLALVALAAGGTYGMLSVFWALPGAYLSGPAAAPGIALISAVGTVGAFAGPWAVGYLRQQSGGFAASFTAVAIFILASGILGVLVGRHILRLSTPGQGELAGGRT
jgi:MFS transporter, ACS family, tartrate transporter